MKISTMENGTEAGIGASAMRVCACGVKLVMAEAELMIMAVEV